MSPRITRLILAAVISLVAASCATSRMPTGASTADDLIVCPAISLEEPPAFEGEDCEEKPFWLVDPQGRAIWVRATIKPTLALMEGEGPVGVFVSAKAAARVYLNGALLGANGAPAMTREAETPGLMDAVFYAPREIVRAGENEIKILMSSHHGFLRFGYPVHWIGMADYSDPTRSILAAYWPSLPPLGALVVGALYFFVMAFTGVSRTNAAILSLADTDTEWSPTSTETVIARRRSPGSVRTRSPGRDPATTLTPAVRAQSSTAARAVCAASLREEPTRPAGNDSYSRAVRRAVASHVNRAAWVGPAAPSRARSSASPTRAASASAQSSGSLPVTRTPEKPWGDRRQEIVFIGAGIDWPALKAKLDACLLPAVVAGSVADLPDLPDPFPIWRRPDEAV